MRRVLLASFILAACHHQPKKASEVRKKSAPPVAAVAPAVNIYLTVNGESVHLRTDSGGQQGDGQFDIKRPPKPPDDGIIQLRPTTTPTPVSQAEEPVRISASDYTLVGVLSVEDGPSIGWFRRPGKTDTEWKIIGGTVGERGGVLKGIVSDTAEIEEEGKVIRLSVFGWGLMSD